MLPKGRSRPAKPARGQHRRGLVVLGMHRSGTSLTAALLCAAGADAPKNVSNGTWADDYNAKGYWEPWRLPILHDELLAAMGVRWDSPTRYPLEFLHSPKGGEFADRAIELLRDEYGSSSLFCLKEPRLCRLLPFWMPLFAAERIEPSFVFVLRHPFEVADSLKRREGFHWSWSVLAWLRYILEAEESTRNQKRVFITYDQLLTDWRGTLKHIGKQIDIEWPRSKAQIDADFDNFVSVELRHHKTDATALSGRDDVVGWVEEIYAACIEAAASGKIDTAVFDRVRGELESASIAFDPILFTLERQARESDSQRDALSAELELESATLDRLKLEAAEALARAEAMTGDLAARDAELGALRKESDSLATHLSNLNAELESRNSDVAQATARAEAMSANVSSRDAELAQLRKESDSLAAHLSKLNAELESRNSDVAQATARAEAMSANVSSRDAELAALRKESDALAAHLATLDAALEARNADSAQAAARAEKMAADLASRDAEMAALRKESDALAAHLATLYAALEARNADAVQAAARAEQMAADLSSRDAELAALRKESDALAAHLATLDAALAARNADVAQAAARAEVTTANLTSRDAELSSLRGERDSLARELASVNTVLETRTAEVAEFAARVETMTVDLSARGTELGSLRKESDVLAAHLAKLDATLETRNAEIAQAAVRAETIAAELSTRDAELGSVRSERDALGAVLAALNAALEARTAQVAEIEERANATASELSFRTEELGSLRVGSDELAAHLERLDAELESLRSERDALTTELGALEGVLETRTAEVAEAAERAETMAAQLANRDSELEALRGRSDELAAHLEKLDSALEARTAELSARELELKSLRDERGALTTEVAHAAERVEAMAADLSTRDAELELLRSRSDELAAHLKRLDAALEAETAELAVRDTEIESLRGERDLLTTEISETAMRAEAMAADLSTRNADLESLRKRSDELAAHLEKLDAALEARTGELSARDAELESLRNERVALSAVLAQLEESLAARKTEVAEAEARAQVMAADLSTRDAELESLRKGSDELAGHLARLDAALDARAGEIAEAEARAEAFHGECEMLTAELASVNARLESSTAETAQARERVEEVTADLASRDVELTSTREELSSTSRELTQLRRKLTSAEAILAETERALATREAALQGEVQSARSVNDSLQMDLRDASAALKAAVRRYRSLTLEVTELDRRFNEARDRFDDKLEQVLKLQNELVGPEIQKRDERIAHLEEALDSARRAVRAYEEGIESQRAALDSSNETIAQQDAEIQSLREELARARESVARRSQRSIDPAGPPQTTAPVRDSSALVASRLRDYASWQAEIERYGSHFPDATYKRGGRDYIWLSVIDYDFRIQRPQHFANELADAGNRVFYCSTVLEPSAGKSTFRIQAEPHRGVFTLGLLLAGDVPFNIYGGFDNAQVGEILGALDEAIYALNIVEPIVVVQYPSWYRVACGIPGATVVHDCLDYVGGFSNVPPEMVRLEKELIDHADLVVTASAPLAEHIAHLRSSTVIRNAADVDFFATAATRDVAGEELQRAATIGYFGAIAEWFQVEWIERCARNRPDWNFVLVGSTAGADVSPLAVLPNITFLGEKPYAELPEILSAFDVATIPFKINELITCTNPVKLYEYMAAGKAVVASPMPEVVAATSLVYIAEDAGEFEAQIEKALREDTRDLRAQRQAWAKQHTWKERALQFKAAVEETFPTVSVVILVYNNWRLTKDCLHSVLNYSDYPKLEVVVVDNGSVDETQEELRRIALDDSRIRVVRSDRNTGFSAGNNLGIRAASGEHVILLNNDTYVTKGWVRDLIRPLIRDAKVGLVGPLTNNIGNEQKINISYEDMDEMHSLSRRFIRNHLRGRFVANRVAFFCVATRRDVIERVGLLDEEYGLGFFEDDDYCHRVSKAGYDVVIADDVFVHHHLSASFNKLGVSEKAAQMERNRAIYENRWGTWIPHVYRDEPGFG